MTSIRILKEDFILYFYCDIVVGKGKYKWAASGVPGLTLQLADVDDKRVRFRWIDRRQTVSSEFNVRT